MRTHVRFASKTHPWQATRPTALRMNICHTTPDTCSLAGGRTFFMRARGSWWFLNSDRSPPTCSISDVIDLQNDLIWGSEISRVLGGASSLSPAPDVLYCSMPKRQYHRAELDLCRLAAAGWQVLLLACAPGVRPSPAATWRCAGGSRRSCYQKGAYAGCILCVLWRSLLQSAG